MFPGVGGNCVYMLLAFISHAGETLSLRHVALFEEVVLVVTFGLSLYVSTLRWCYM